MWQTGTGHFIDLNEDSTSEKKRFKRKWEPPSSTREGGSRYDEMGKATGGVEGQLQSPRGTKRPKQPVNSSPASSSATADDVNRQLQAPRGTKPIRQPANPASDHSSQHEGQTTRQSQSGKGTTTHATNGPAKAHRQSLASVTDASSAGEDQLHRQLQNPRGTSTRSAGQSLVSVPDSSSQHTHPASDSFRQPVVGVPDGSTTTHRSANRPISSSTSSVGIEIAVVGQDTVDDQLSVLSPVDTTTLQNTTQARSAASVSDDHKSKDQLPAQASEETTPVSACLNQEESTSQNQQEPSKKQQQLETPSIPRPLEENLSEVVGLRQMVKIFAPDDEITDIVTPWVSDIFLGKSTNQISSWIKDQHETLRKLSLTPATLDMTTRWIQDCAHVDALMIPGDFHVILSSMNVAEPGDMSDETLHKMPKNASGLYTELRTLVSFLSPNTDLSLYDLITMLCRQLLESPGTMNFASHRLFQYVAARLFVDESTFRDASGMDQIASNLLHLFRLAASTYVRRYLFSEYNVFTKNKISTSSVTEGSAEFGRMVRQSVFVQFLLSFFRRLRVYQGFGSQDNMVGKQQYIDNIVI
eukprot:Nitzschia sp. Nitz4//scaffold17_size182527//101186//103024//NITZ4_001860-RA/size182527-augustus-gene-0.7-mRNA-1//1//CDS//3329539358//2088//frame0